MLKAQPDYLAYQLRLRRACSKGRTVWRASLKSAQTRECKELANLDELFDFLRQQTSASLDSGNGELLDVNVLSV
ncbi:MAG: hypothetical protein GY832_36510 [Chloroflexi bacterium]|nr:hypothetical protein [Chloroflexota bacterium]